MPVPCLTQDFIEPWQQYQHPLVRQLAFAVGSPNILSQVPDKLELEHAFDLHSDQIWQQYLENYHPRLLELDQNPQALENFVAQLKSTRLGLRFEMLIWFWLLDKGYHPYTLLGHSIQKIDGPKTLGELDFLLFNKLTEKIEHWEIALKYYLDEADFSLPHWYGLNRSDTLNRKLKHFTQKQFQFQDALDYPIDQRFCVLKGQLFLPIHHIAPIPDWVNTGRRLGRWGYQIPTQEKYFYRLQRHEWIYPNRHMSSDYPQWWTNGLYKSALSGDFYMFRVPTLI